MPHGPPLDRIGDRAPRGMALPVTVCPYHSVERGYAPAVSRAMDALGGHYSASGLRYVFSLLGQRMLKRIDLERTAPQTPCVVMVGGLKSSLGVLRRSLEVPGHPQRDIECHPC